MANSWSKEDRLHYEKSEVWQELEKHIINTVHRAGILQQKINEKTAIDKAAQLDAATVKAVKDANPGDPGAAGKMLKGMADEASDEVAEDGLEEEGDDLHDEVVDDLRALAASAIAEGNIKLAYKIERTIDEILERKVVCE